MAEIPFSEAVLEHCKNTHVLVAVFPLSILDIFRAKSNLFDNQGWYNQEPFANDCGLVGWHLISKMTLDKSMLKEWDQKLEDLIRQDEEIPSVQVLVYTMAGYFLATGENLFETIHALSSSCDLGNLKVPVRFFKNVIEVGNYWATPRYRYGLVLTLEMKPISVN